MARFKLLLFVVLATSALGAFASASASADPAKCNLNTGLFVFCDHTGRQLGTPLVLLLALGLPAILEGKVGGAALTIECESAHIDITILLLGRTRGRLIYLKCKVNAPAGCTVTETITANFNDLLVGVMGKPEDLLEGAGAGEEFAELVVTVCPVAGTYKVTGLQLVEIANGETSLAEHLFVAKKSGSKLKLGVESASYSGTAHDLRLESGLPWLVMLGI